MQLVQRLLPTLIAAATIATPTIAQDATAEPRHPNILLIVSDDLGARDLSHAGSTFYETPRIDALAEQGIVFTRAYTAHPRCVPSRNALVTGQYSARNGQPGRPGVSIDADDTTLAEALAPLGYRSLFVGKWHLGGDGDGPTNHGWDHSIASSHAGAPRSYLAPYNESRSSHSEKAEIPGLDDAPEGEHLTDRLTTETIAWLRDHDANHDEPFFVTLSYYAVHTPLMGLDADIARFADRVPTRADGTPEFLLQDGETKTTQDSPVYAGMLWRLDQNVGRLLDLLDELSIADDTLVIFTSDHGGLSNRGLGNRRPIATSNLPLRAGKGHLYEGGIRIPMIARWPGVIEPGTSDAPVLNTDHHATLTDLVAGSVTDGIDGVSYLPTLRGETQPADRAMYWHAPRPRPDGTGDIACSAMIQGQWKIMLWHDTGEVALYKLSEDPGELDERSRRNPTRAADMRAQLESWLQDIDAIEPRLTEGAAPSTPGAPDAERTRGGDEAWHNDPDRDRSPEARAARQAEREARRREREAEGSAAE